MALKFGSQAWADALGSRIGEAELEGASATIDRITRALREDRGE